MKIALGHLGGDFKIWNFTSLIALVLFVVLIDGLGWADDSAKLDSQVLFVPDEFDFDSAVLSEHYPIAAEEGKKGGWYDQNSKRWIPLQRIERNDSESQIVLSRSQFAKQVNSQSASAQDSFWAKLFEFLYEVLQQFGFLSLVVIISAGVVLLSLLLFLVLKKAYGPTFLFSNRKKGEKGVELEQAPRLEDLPFAVEETSLSLLERARLSFEAGDHNASIVFLFGHILLRLDEETLIRLHKGKTNRNYVREVRSFPEVMMDLGLMVKRFEEVFFGAQTVDRDSGEQFWNQYEKLEQKLTDLKGQYRDKLNGTLNQDPLAGSIETHSMSAFPCWLVGLFVVTTVVGTSGCSMLRSEPFRDRYGEAIDQQWGSGPSGLRIFRSVCERRGIKAARGTVLSNRTARFDTILWAPNSFYVPTDPVLQWFDHWLSNGKGRTLIFIGRGYSPSNDYWRALSQDSAFQQDRKVHIEYARSLLASSELEFRRDSTSESRWLAYDYDVSEKGETVSSVSGPWAVGLEETPRIVQAERLMPSHEVGEPLKGQLKSWPEEYETLMSPEEQSLSSNDARLLKTPSEIETNVLLSDSQGIPVIFEFTSPAWNDGKILVLSNMSPIANLNMVRAGNLQIADQLIQVLKPSSRLCFLMNDWTPNIRYGQDDGPVGFEMLRVWPLSLITIHALFLGGLVLLAVLPIFGRPQKLKASNLTDFGKHVAAFGEHLQKSRDRQYALQRIALYFREVKREASSDWSQYLPIGRSNADEDILNSNNNKSKND